MKTALKKYSALIIVLSFIPFMGFTQPTSSAELRPSIHTIRSGNTFYSLLKSNGFSRSQTNSAIADIKNVDIWGLSPKTKYWRLKLDKGIALKFFHPTKDLSLNFIRQGNTARAELKKEDYRVEVMQRQGKVRGSLISSIMQKIPDLPVAYRFLDAYRFHYNLKKQVQRNAHFSITVEKKYLGKYFIRYGEILKTEIGINGKTDRRYFIKTASGGGFVSMTDLQESRPLYAPVDYVRISSEYKPRRFHPIKKRTIAHLGLDFELPSGEPVYTAGAGVVLRKGKNRAAGRYVVVRHKNNIETFYNHLESINPAIKPGKRVKNGQRVGAIGCSGYCTKPHLHFAVKKLGRYKNPIDYLKTFSFTNKAQLENQIERMRRVARSGQAQ